MVTAHLDSINHDGGPLANAPGADDNGSGSAGIIEMAHVFRNFRHNMIFVLSSLVEKNKVYLEVNNTFLICRILKNLGLEQLLIWI